jgi:DNA-binding XRE family transcriptional regulator
MSNDFHINEFGKRIKAIRKKRKKTQEELAELLKVSRKTIQNWESGKTLPEEIPLLKSICLTLDCDLDYLFGNIPDYKRAVTDICDETGLSSVAVSNILEMRGDGNITSQQTLFLNALLRDFELFSNLAATAQECAFLKNHKSECSEVSPDDDIDFEIKGIGLYGPTFRKTSGPLSYLSACFTSQQLYLQIIDKLSLLLEDKED